MVLFPRVLAENPDRLMSDTGIQLRINRSIQVEGAFGVLKQETPNMAYRTKSVCENPYNNRYLLVL